MVRGWVDAAARGAPDLAAAVGGKLGLFKGKCGADLNFGGSSRRRAPHSAGHACPINIAESRAFVQIAPASPVKARLDQPCFFCALVVEPRR
jgi:hypothetical protein